MLWKIWSRCFVGKCVLKIFKKKLASLSSHHHDWCWCTIHDCVGIRWIGLQNPLRSCHGGIEDGTHSQQQSLLILNSSYFIFLLPIAIIVLIPEAVSNRAFISVSIYLWYWFVYVVNFFIYVIFWRRIRTGIILMMKDLFETLELMYMRIQNHSGDQCRSWIFKRRKFQNNTNIQFFKIYIWV